MTKTALVTGGAGFIGSHVADKLLSAGWRVDVVDNFDSSYPAHLKRRNVAGNAGRPEYRLFEIDIRDSAALDISLGHYDSVIHLAGKAGPRQSISEPELFEDVNVNGTRSILEFCAQRSIRHVIFASSSSVYGLNDAFPWKETAAPAPISPYAETKVRAENVGRQFAEDNGSSFTALRFFTVFGPRQRPGLAMRLFAQQMLRREPVPVFGDGTAQRDFTFVGDIVAGIEAAIDRRPRGFEIFNLGSNRPVTVMEMLRSLERALGMDADIDWCAADSADLPLSWADITKARRELGYAPSTSFDAGVNEFAAWVLASESDRIPADEAVL
jgi:UDP-glucuronate 4-epimerase